MNHRNHFCKLSISRSLSPPPFLIHLVINIPQHHHTNSSSYNTTKISALNYKRRFNRHLQPHTRYKLRDRKQSLSRYPIAAPENVFSLVRSCDAARRYLACTCVRVCLLWLIAAADRKVYTAREEREREARPSGDMLF